MPLIPINEDGQWRLPCLACGAQLEYEIIDPVVHCSCGIRYSQEYLAGYRTPGVWRHWIAAFACTCGRVSVVGDTVHIESHKCRMGRVTAPTEDQELSLLAEEPALA